MNRKNTLLEDLKNLQMMFDVMGDYLFVLDTEGCIQHANPTILQDLGYAEETLLGKHLRDLHPPDRREEVEESITAMLASEGDRYTIPLLTANDTLLDVETRARVGQWQGQPALIVVSRSMATPNQKCDVTVQKQAEIEQERFATRLNTAAEIAEQIGAILDVETLLKTVIPLIKERFGLYYVHVYTLNEDAGVLSLRAGYGEPGRIMVEQGHHIPLDRRQSLVATAARTKDVVLVNDVSEDPNFLPNPLLPDTRSEVAIPAIARGKVLGVFDVQHNVAGYFTQADLNVFLTLAGQIANALQSAALFSQAEAERDRAQRYLESAGSAIVVLNAQAEITLINQAGCEALGYTEQELLGQNWFELVVPPGLREDGKANFPKLIAGELPPRSEYIAPVTTKNGDERVMNWHDSVLWDEKGNIIGTLSSGDDITERLRTEEQAKTFQTLAETATDAILMADLETQQITYANRAAHTLFGCDYENREMVGTAGSQFWAEEDLPRLPQILEQAILEGWQGDVQQRRLDGSVFAANVTAFALQDTAQRSTHLVIMARDITERLQMEMEAREQAAQNRALLEAIPDMMFRFDKEGVFIDFKAESGQELLAPPEIFLGRHVAEVLPPNIANVTLEHLPHVLETGAPATYEYQAPMGDVLHHYEARLVRSGKDEVLGLVRDVTEQRKAETRVRESQQLLASFLNNFPDLAFAKNKQGTVILSNQVLEKTFPVEGGVLGKTVYDLVPPEFAEKIWTSEKAVIDTGETITIEELVPMDDGMHTKLTTKFPLYDSEGNATGLGGVSFDITDRKQAEVELQRLGSAVKQTADGIAIADLEGNLIFTNPAWAEMHGYTIEELQGQHLSMFHTAQQLQNEVGPFNDVVMQAGFQQGEVGHVHKDGTTFPTMMTSTLLKDSGGNPTGIVGTVRDITAQKQAETELRTNEERFRRMSTTMQDGLTIIEGREVVHINDRLEEILGYPKEQIARMSSLDYAAPEEIERIKTVMQEARSGKRDLTDLAFWIVRPDGQRRFIHNRYSMITDESGQITGRFVFTTDETDREVAEAERQRFTLRLNTASEIVSQVNAILDPEKVLQAVIPLLKERFGLYYVHVYTLDEELQELQLQAGYGEPGRIMLERGHTIPLDRKQSLVASAARAGELVLVDDVTEDPNFLPNPLLPDTKTEVAVPMIVGEQVLGVFDIQHDQAHFFTDADLDIFRTLAGQLATTLYNAGLFTQTQMRLRVGRALATTQTEDEVWDALIGVADFYPEAQVSLFTFDPNAAERTLVLRRIDSFASGLVEAVSPGMPFPEKAFPVISQITADEPFVSANVFADDRVDAGTQGLSQQTGGVSMALLPILAGDEWLGLIAVLSSQKGYFDTRKLHLYKALAEQGGVALQAARLNEAIDASARRFRGLYEASPLGIILNDFETGEYLEANEAFVGMVGHSLDELNQLTYWDLTPRKYAGDEQKQIHAMETTGRYGPYEKEYIRKDGTVLPVILNGVVVTDPNGRRVIWSTVEDITARKEAEAALQLTRASIEQSQDAYFWFDAEAIFTDVSDATCAILGYSREELLALRVFDIDPVFPEEAWPGLKEQVKAAGTVTLESQHRTKEGKTFPVEVSVSHLQFGGEEIYFSVAKDITDRKEAESRVRIFQALAENAADAITMGDVGGRVTYANRAAHEMLGYDYEQREMHGMSMSQLAAEEEIARQNGAVQQIMANGGGWTGDANSKRKDGTFVDVSITMFPVLDENAQPVSIAAILRDITDRKAAEQERERFTNQLATAADISTRASTILDPQRLLQAAVELIKTRFDLYHVHVYTLNQETWTLDIQAGSGEAGKIMREQGHSIPLVQERSLVARAARDGEIIVVTDVTEGADFMPNPLLPETRTEVTIPLMVGDDILGVFDVQDDEAGRFTAADLDVFRTLAGQLATALRNAQLFATQQQVETQLRRERQLFVGGPVVVFRWVNTEGWPVEYVSPNVETFIGHPAKALMSSEVPYATLVHPDDLARVGSEVQQFSEEGHSYFEQEYRMVRADGEVIWIYDFTIVIRNERGEITHYDGYIMDITARKEAEATAIAQAERSRALLETIPDMMFLFNQDGTFLDFKAEAGQELLVPPELFLGRKVHQVLPPHIADLTMENLHKALATRKLHTFVYQSPIGEEVHTYEARIGRVSPTTGLGLVRDITERQRAQAERERFAAQLSTAAEIARQVGTILDTDELLNTVIPLLKERFGLYHAQVYVLEEATGDLVLRAGYGPIGQIMLEQGHRIGAEQEQSLVQRAATIRDVVVANDVLQEADFMPNLLLPETRAEVAVPAMIGEQVIGVFDVQSDQVDFFTEADLNVYRTLAGQIASAFQTARLFEQQKETQQALRAAVEKTRAIFEAMTEGLVVTGMMGKIEDLNDATLRLHGFKNREEVVGRSAMQLFDRAYWSRAAETMRRAMEMGRSELSAYRMIRSDRSTFEAEMNAALLRDADGKPAGFVNIIRDITERTRAEAERARFAAELRTAADISSQVTSILDPQELLDRVVALMKEQFNLYHVNIYTLDAEARRLTLTASYGETGRILVTQSQPISLEAEGSLVARAARDKEIILIEDVAEAPDLQPHPLLPQVRSQVAVPALFGHQVLGVFEVLHNEAHYFTQADLDVFRTLAGQTAASFQNARYFEEIQQAAERLREMDQLKSEFLANMSHELRTPLNSIIGYAEVMLMGIDGELDTETLEDVRAIYENGQHLLAMINDVLDLAKIEAGRLNLKLEDLDLGVLLEDVKTSSVGLLNKYKKQEHVEVQVTVEDDLPMVQADRVRINQVLANLVSNAIKFTEKGYVRIRGYRSAQWVCVEVKDTGIGIAPEYLEQIFEKFRQVDGSSRRQSEGTGLGLAITRYLVQMHGGSIEVKSQPGQGSTFLVKLPVQGQPTE